MKRVDEMIKYLSGDLSPEESLAFERELNGNPRLKQEFSELSLAYNLIADQVKRSDEEAFSLALDAAINKSGSGSGSRSGPVKRKKNKNRLGYLLLSVAASLLLFAGILLTQKSPERIYFSYYNPSLDPVIMTLQMDPRGEADLQSIANLWKGEEYENCRIEALGQLKEDPSDLYVLLFYLLSSMETDEAGLALERLKSIETDTGQALGQAIHWYGALALVKEGETSEATVLLTPLCHIQGPYKKDANKLKNKLKK